MHIKRLVAGTASIAALAFVAALYTTHEAKSSDHQDTYNLANSVGHNTSADITDVYVFPAPDNANNVVFAMDVSPLIPAGMGAQKFFDPSLLWQFKISHTSSYVEDQVIQMTASGTDASQTLTLYGPGKPNEVGTANTVLTTPTGNATYNNATKLQNNTVQFFAGPRADPFKFDLFAFFTFLGDRNYGTHTSQSDPGAGNTFINGDTASNLSGLAPPYDQTATRPTMPSFNGFASGTTSGAFTNNYACSTSPATNTLSDFGGGFNVLSYVVEVPRSLIYGGSTGFSSSIIHVWATVSSSKTTN